MEIIGIIIFFVFMLLRVFSKLPDIKQKLPREWEQEFPPIIREMGFPWGGQNGSDRREGTPLPEGNTAPNGEEEFETEQPAPAWVVSQVPEPQEAGELREPVPESPAVGDIRLCNEQGLLLNEHAVLNGIIWSEILNPPKSKRLVSGHG